MYPNDTPQLPLFTTAPSDPSKEILFGYCQCGCGGLAPIAKANRPERGHTKGQPISFINGHNGRMPVVERFWAMVNKHGPIHPILGTACWLWTGCKMKFGHGQFNIGNHEIQLAHRFSYELHYGPIPAGENVCHHCDNPPCIRPDHLFSGTQADNMGDAASKGRTSRLGSGDAAPRGSDHWNAKLTEDQVVEILNLRNQGLSYAKIAEGYDVIPQYIGELCRGEGWNHIDRPAITFTDAVRILTEPDVIVILRRLKAGETQSALGREYGVHKGTINSIVRGMSWKHIPRP